MHKMEWEDVLRIVEAMDSPLCGSITLLHIGAEIFNHVWRMVADCPYPAREAFLVAFFGLLGRDIIISVLVRMRYLEVDRRGDLKDFRAGGGGVSGDFGREKKVEKNAERNAELLDEMVTINR
jgi:hypothetical protein